MERAQNMGETGKGYSFLMSFNGDIFSSSLENTIKDKSIFLFTDNCERIAFQNMLEELKKGNSGSIKITRFKDIDHCHLFYTPIEKAKLGYVFIISDENFLSTKQKK